MTHPPSAAQEPATRPSLKPARALLLFNPAAGALAGATHNLPDILAGMQAHNFLTEVHVVTPQSQLDREVAGALRRGIRLVVVSGGDGTIESAAGPLVGSGAVLGILPTGTRNNIALSLGIPFDLNAAIGLLRAGRVQKVDVGQAHTNERRRWFLETSSMGLVSALYPAADEIQHGNLARITDFLATLFNSQPSQVEMRLESGEQVRTNAHVALVANMPYFGPNFQISDRVSFTDRWLDVFLFSELTKLELVTYAMQIIANSSEDARVLHYRARSLMLRSDPPMPVMADGEQLGEGQVTVTVARQALNVLAPAVRVQPEVQDS